MKMTEKLAEAIKYVKKNPDDTIINATQAPRDNKTYEITPGKKETGENYLLNVKPHPQKILAALGVLKVDAKKMEG